MLSKLYESSPVEPDSSELEKKRVDRYRNIGAFISLFSRSREVLDIGSGTGIGLIGFKDIGFKVTGLEPDGRSKSLKHHPDIDIISENIEDFLRGSGYETFNVVTMIHVLEHIYQPRKVIDGLSKLIKDEGFFMLKSLIF